MSNPVKQMDKTRWSKECPICHDFFVPRGFKTHMTAKHKPVKQTQEWEREFEEIGFGNQAMIVGVKRVELKDFIRSLLTSQKQEMVEEIRGMTRDHYWDSLSEDSGLIIKHIDGILSALEKGEK